MLWWSAGPSRIQQTFISRLHVSFEGTKNETSSSSLHLTCAIVLFKKEVQFPSSTVFSRSQPSPRRLNGGEAGSHEDLDGIGSRGSQRFGGGSATFRFRLSGLRLFCATRIGGLHRRLPSMYGKAVIDSIVLPNPKQLHFHGICLHCSEGTSSYRMGSSAERSSL